MPGAGKERGLAGNLHQAPQVHHAHGIADITDHAQIVRDEEIRQAQALLKVAQQVQNLRLHGDIEGGDGFIGHYQPRFGGKSARDPDTLPLPPLKACG